MPTYRKKPVEIEAVEVAEANLLTIKDYEDCEIQWEQTEYEYDHGGTPSILQVQVFTVEGPLLAREGDWIITGVQGERYPCKPNIFRETYERVEE